LRTVELSWALETSTPFYLLLRKSAFKAIMFGSFSFFGGWAGLTLARAGLIRQQGTLALSVRLAMSDTSDVTGLLAKNLPRQQDALSRKSVDRVP
jgi:hypothetical protein